MTIDIQLISFIYFFVFGIIIEVIYEFITKKYKKISYIVNSILTIIFMYCLFHINNGKIHPYFIITYLLGILICKICVKLLKKYIHLLVKK